MLNPMHKSLQAKNEMFPLSVHVEILEWLGTVAERYKVVCHVW